MNRLPFLLFAFLLAFSSWAEHTESGAPRAPAERPQAPAAGKPALIYLSSFKSKDDLGIVESGRREVARLESCGFDVRNLEVENVDTLKAQLTSGNFPADTPVFVSASHGLGKPKSNGFQELRIDPDGYDLSAPKLLKNIREIAPQSSIYLDVCYAGLCRDGSCEGVGTACSSKETSSFTEGSKGTQFPTTEALIDLYCDSIQGCEEIKKGDKNSDGALDGKEINAYLSEKFTPESSKRDYRATEHGFQTWEEARAEQKKCQAAGHQFTCAENRGSLKADVKVASQLKEGQWVAFSVLESARPIRGPKRDIPTARKDFSEEDYSKKEFSPALRRFLQGQWPDPSDPEAKEFISEVAGVSIDKAAPGKSPYEISSDGKEISGKDREGESFRYLLDSGSQKPNEALIQCKCVSNEAIPRVPTQQGERQPYFDPSFKLKCQER